MIVAAILSPIPGRDWINLYSSKDFEGVFISINNFDNFRQL